MRGLFVVALLAAVASTAHAQRLIVLGSEFSTQPRVQRFVIDNNGNAYVQEDVTSSVIDVLDWMDRHISAVEDVLSTVFGVYSCPYQGTLPSDVLMSARQVFLNQLEDEQYYYDTEYAEYAEPVEMLQDNAVQLRLFDAPHSEAFGVATTQYIEAGSLPHVFEELFGAPRPVAPLDATYDEAEEAARLSGYTMDYEQPQRQLGAWTSAYDRYDDEEDVYFIEAVTTAADAEWALATWDFALFLALAGACVVVWAAMFTTCCQLRCACAPVSAADERRAAYGDASTSAELLEPLALNDFQEPARVVVNNPAFARA